MYDMYPWNQQADGRDDATEAVHAVQVALDRRDNGGAASAHSAAVTAGGPPLRGSHTK